MKTWETLYKEAVKLLGKPVEYPDDFPETLYAVAYNPNLKTWLTVNTDAPEQHGAIPDFEAHAIIEKYLREYLDAKEIQACKRYSKSEYYIARLSAQGMADLQGQLSREGYIKLVQMTEERFDSYPDALVQGLRIVEAMKC